jgi:hypothetical protein
MHRLTYNSVILPGPTNHENHLGSMKKCLQPHRLNIGCLSAHLPEGKKPGQMKKEAKE